MAGDEDILCPCCNDVVNEDDKALGCEGMCKKWHHISCINISNEDYKRIQDLKDKVKWFCVSCTAQIDHLLVKVCDVEDFLNLNNMVKHLIDLTKGVVNDNLLINDKLSGIDAENTRLSKDVSDVRQDVNNILNIDKKDEKKTISQSTKTKEKDQKVSEVILRETNEVEQDEIFHDDEEVSYQGTSNEKPNVDKSMVSYENLNTSNSQSLLISDVLKTSGTEPTADNSSKYGN